MHPVEIFLNFHGIGLPGPHIPPQEIPYWLSIDQFKAVIDLVRSSKNLIRLTLDDGNASDLATAVPILRRAELRAAFFIVTDRIGADGYLSERDILTLKKEGMAIGSHGAAHVAWTGCSQEELLNQVFESTRRLARIVDVPVEEVAVPFGAYNRRVLRTLRRCSLSRVYTSDGGPAAIGSWLVPRNTIRSDMDLSWIAEMVNNRFPGRAKSALRKWGLIR